MKRAKWHEEIADYLYQLESTLSPDDKLLIACKALDKFIEMASFYASKSDDDFKVYGDVPLERCGPGPKDFVFVGEKAKQTLREYYAIDESQPGWFDESNPGGYFK